VTAAQRWKSPVLLDAMCLAAITVGSTLPYHAPAIVFEADWDTGGALTLLWAGACGAMSSAHG
jgi:hypothetical protein